MKRTPEQQTARELKHLHSRNAQLKVDVRRYELLQRRLRAAPIARKEAVVVSPFAITDPRATPQVGTKVLQPLTPPIRVAQRMAAAVVAELRLMTIETRALVKSLAAKQRASVAAAMDALPDDVQHQVEALQRKYRARFANLAEAWAPQMINDVLTQSSAQLNMNLHDVADRLAIQTTMSTPRMRDIVEASTKNSVGLIVRIPQQYLADVQVQVMSAITTGSGLDKLVPYLTKRYHGDARHARFVALDQVRKASESVNAERLQALGVEEYVWIHVGGERYPRKLHQSYSGRTFRYDEPPIIDERTGARGKPGDAINCRCRQRAVVNFTKLRTERGTL